MCPPPGAAPLNEPTLSPTPFLSRRTPAGIVAAVFAAPLLFATITHQVWEDYFITFRSSRNLAEGHGLVYQIGEKVHTFTSPLGVLLPALGFELTHSDAGALWFLRIVSALALAATAVIVVRFAGRQGWNRSATWFAVCLGLLEVKTIAFSANGMETAVLVLFTALVWQELTRPGGARWKVLAVSYAGLMWTRPDAFVVAGAMTFGWWVFGPRSPAAPGERAWWRQLGAAVVIGGLLYLPWFLWAWHYYGSPVPQTIIAKSALMPGGLSFWRVLTAPLAILTDTSALDGLFAPIYSVNGWPLDLLLAGRLLARLAAFVWVVPFLPRATRAASLALLIGGVYFHQIMPYPWYYAPWTLLGALALAGAGWTVTGRLGPLGGRVLRITGAVAVAGILLIDAAEAYSARIQQRVIEDTGRHEIGLWLKAHAAPGDRVFLEPIGYIGYYSQLKILDFPGLTAPEVSRIVHTGTGGYAKIIRTLKPEWMVLRPFEVTNQNLLNSGVLADYDAVGDWNHTAEIDDAPFLPGRNWLRFDAEYYVFHRKKAAAAPVPTR